MYKSIFVILVCLGAAMVLGQSGGATPAEKPALKPDELEQLLAPIALYPDSLLTQMLMASTYPLEIVEADRWVKKNKDLKGDDLAKELEKQTWDASVKSMVNFPDQLAVMSEKLDITMKLGDAFIDQQADVMNTIQVLRNKAQAAGNLKSDQQVKVEAAPAPAPAAAQQQQTTVVQQPPQIITIQSSSPTVVPVPAYDPTKAYGAWPYPPPPPYYPPRPPGYIASSVISFGVGVACGAAWGYAFGNCNWGSNDVDIDVNRNTNFNTNIDRSKYQQNINNRQTAAGGKAGSWQHDPSHRKGAPYKSQASAQKFGGADQARAAQARQQFRGQSDTGRLDSAGGRGGNQPSNLGGQARGGAQDRGGAGRAGADRGGADRGGAQDRGGSRGAAQDRGAGAADRGGAAARPSAADNRAGGGNARSGAFSDADRSGRETRAASQRGQASRSAGSARTGGGSKGR